MCRCLFELKRYKETHECLIVYKTHFPSSMREAVTTLENDLSKATSPSSRSSDESRSSSSSAAETPRTRRNFLIRFRRSSSDRSTSNDEAAIESPSQGEDSEPSVFVEEADDSRSSADITEEDNQEAVIESSDGSGSSRSSKRSPLFLEYENEYKENSVDYETRFCGHCNTTTDIKEASYFGKNFIVAGSDDGSFFIWDRETTNIVRIMKGDESIVNCLQPHPTSCCLATSGIESVVRIWCPMPEVVF